MQPAHRVTVRHYNLLRQLGSVYIATTRRIDNMRIGLALEEIIGILMVLLMFSTVGATLYSWSHGSNLPQAMWIGFVTLSLGLVISVSLIKIIQIIGEFK